MNITVILYLQLDVHVQLSSLIWCFGYVVLNALAFCYETQQQFSDAERLYLNQLSALNSSPNSNRRDIITGEGHL